MGVAAGEAAAMCRELGETPRGIWKGGHVRELQRRLGGGFPGCPDPKTEKWAVVDDETPGVKFGWGWSARFNVNGEQVGHMTHFPGRNVDDAVYPLPVARKGRYVLMGRTPYEPRAAIGSTTAFEIESGGKKVEFRADQAQATGTWRRLGEFDLSPGATLRIIPTKSSGFVVADGFALVDASADERSGSE